MIINIRGTSGSGKTHLVKSVIAALKDRGAIESAVMEAGRKRPLVTRYDAPNTIPVSFIGHYAIACGGCDTIQGNDKIYDLVRSEHMLGRNVVFEGLLISAETARAIALSHDFPLLVVGLNTPLDECLASVNARRREKTPDKADVNPKNTTSKFKGVASSMKKLEANGVRCCMADRQGALERVLAELNL